MVLAVVVKENSFLEWEVQVELPQDRVEWWSFVSLVLHLILRTPSFTPSTLT